MEVIELRATDCPARVVSKVRENGSNDFDETLHVVAHPKDEKSDEARFSKKKFGSSIKYENVLF